MNAREISEQNERLILCDKAMLSSETAGRRFPEAESDLRTCYQRDRDRIIHCKAFRRLEAQNAGVFIPRIGSLQNPPYPHA